MYSAQTKSQYYQSMGRNAHVLNADPHELVSLLLRQARSKIHLAMEAGNQGDIATRTQGIHRACAVIDGLHVSLNPEAGGEVARNLEDLYDYMHRRLLHANAHPEDQTALQEVDGLLSTVQDAWLQIQPDALEA